MMEVRVGSGEPGHGGCGDTAVSCPCHLPWRPVLDWQTGSEHWEKLCTYLNLNHTAILLDWKCLQLKCG